MKVEIPLINSDLVAVIDQRDAYLCMDWKWYVADRHWIIYALGHRAGQYTLMHRLITGAAPHELVDHIDRDGLNNRRRNLRMATPSESSQNQKKRRDAVWSQYKGVSINNGRYRAQIKKQGIAYHLGYFDDEVEAALAYDAKALELYGPNAAVNFKAELGVGPTWGEAK